LNFVVKILCSNISVISSVDHRPSVIACASIFASSNEKLSQQLVKLKLSSLSSSGLLDNVSPNFTEFLSFFSYSLFLDRYGQKGNKIINAVLLFSCQEHVYSCYSTMIQEANKDKTNSSDSIPASGISAIGTSRTTLENPFSKRRRLQFPNDD
jgi:hypothetical protein